MTTTDAQTDQQIIQAIQQGKQDAFAELYDRHNTWLLAVAYRILRNRNDAEDLLHDVFIEIWKKADSYDPNRGSVTAWLAVKIRSRALDRLRTLNTVKKHIVEQSATEIDFVAPQDQISSAVNHNQARQLLAQLNQVQRTVIELSYFKGLTCQEIANHCQMPLGTVKSTLLRGMQKLRKNFNHHEVSTHVSR